MKFELHGGAVYLSGGPVTKHAVSYEDGRPCEMSGSFNGEWAIHESNVIVLQIGCSVVRLVVGAETADSIAYRAGWEKAAGQRRKVCPKSFRSDAERDGWVDCWAERAA